MRSVCLDAPPPPPRPISRHRARIVYSPRCAIIVEIAEIAAGSGGGARFGEGGAPVFVTAGFDVECPSAGVLTWCPPWEPGV